MNNQGHDKEPTSKNSDTDGSQKNIESNDKNNDLEEKPYIDILLKLRERIEEIGDRNYTTLLADNNISEEANTNTINCIACLLPIEKGDVALSMPCCGAPCHVSCIAKISTFHPTSMLHACPHCMKDLNREQESLFICMNQEIENVLHNSGG